MTRFVTLFGTLGPHMFERLLDQFCLGLRVLLGVLMGCLAVPVAMQVISRYTGLIPTYLWTEELATFLFVWIVMIGSVVAVWDGTHFDVRITRNAITPVFELLQRGIVHLAILIFGAVFLYYGFEYTEFGARQRSVMMRANLAITHVSVPVAGALWCLMSAVRLGQTISKYLTTKGLAQ